MAAITIPRPEGTSSTRTFDVLINAPADVTQVGADSPYYAGTLAFFGPMMPGMKMSSDATFAIPLPQKLPALTAPGVAAAANTTLNIRVVPANGPGGAAPALKSVAVGPL
jgi:tyrosinase